MMIDSSGSIAWLAGLFDCRGTISVSQSANIIGTVTLNLSSQLLVEVVSGLLTDKGIECKLPTRIGKTYKLNFTSSRGTQVLLLLQPYLRNPEHITRVSVYANIFPIEHKGQHMKLDRLEGYKLWLELLTEEVDDATHKNIVEKIKG